MINNIIKSFGITKELISFNDENWLALEKDSSNSEYFELINASEMLVPLPCGHELIRIGPKNDGGYLVPDDLVGIENCFSPGTANTKYFEDDLANKYRIKSFMCDYSSDIEKFITPIIPELQIFEKKWLDISENDISIEINSWVGRNSSNELDSLLQMDIEGYEYKNLIHASNDTLKKFRIIVLEIHHLNLLQYSQFLKGVFIPTLRKLTSFFTCVHVHPNNCCPVVRIGNNIEIPTVIELTFLRKDRFIYNTNIPLCLPHHLDSLNIKSKANLAIPGWLTKFADNNWEKYNAIINKISSLEEKIQYLASEFNKDKYKDK